MLNPEQTAAVEALINDLVKPEALAPFVDLLNATVKENAEKWRAEHDPHAPEPLPPFDDLKDIAAKDIAQSVRTHLAGEAIAISLWAAVKTKQIAPWAVPYYHGTANDRQEALVILDSLFRAPWHDSFRQYYANNVSVERTVDDDGKLVIATSQRAQLHIPDESPRQREEILRRLHKKGVSAPAVLWKDLKAVLQPMNKAPAKEERHLSVLTDEEVQLALEATPKACVAELEP